VWKRRRSVGRCCFREDERIQVWRRRRADKLVCRGREGGRERERDKESKCGGGDVQTGAALGLGLIMLDQ